MSPPETVPATARIELANRIVEASRLLVSRGMNRGASGNISIRNKMTPSAMDGFLITPSGIDPAKMTSNTICQMNMAGEHEKNRRLSPLQPVYVQMSLRAKHAGAASEEL